MKTEGGVPYIGYCTGIVSVLYRELYRAYIGVISELYRAYIGVISGLYRGYIGVISGLYRGYIGVISGVISGLYRFCGVGYLGHFHVNSRYHFVTPTPAVFARSTPTDNRDYKPLVDNVDSAFGTSKV
jgi:hypothetical protein